MGVKLTFIKITQEGMLHNATNAELERCCVVIKKQLKGDGTGEQTMKIKAITKEGKPVVLINATCDGIMNIAITVDSDGKIEYWNAGYITVIDEDYIPKENRQ